jgi:hypothetical protein
MNVHWSSCRVPVILVRFYWKLNFLDRISRNTQISNLMKIRPVGAEFHVDGRLGKRTWRSFAYTCESDTVYVGANISNGHTVSSFRVGNHQPEYVIGRDHRVYLHIVP